MFGDQGEQLATPADGDWCRVNSPPTSPHTAPLV